MPTRVSGIGQYALIAPGFAFQSDDENDADTGECATIGHGHSAAGSQPYDGEMQHARGNADVGGNVSNGVAGATTTMATNTGANPDAHTVPTVPDRGTDTDGATSDHADTAMNMPSERPPSTTPMDVDTSFTTPPPLDTTPEWPPATVIRPYKQQRLHPIMSGYCRRRIGRGGRVFIDRCRPDYDRFHELTRLTDEQKQDMLEQRDRIQRAKVLREQYGLQREHQKEQAAVAAAAAAMSGTGAGGGLHSGHQGAGSAVLVDDSSGGNGVSPAHHRSGTSGRGGGGGGAPATPSGSSSSLYGGRGRGRGSGARRGDSSARHVPTGQPVSGTKSGSHGNPYAKAYNGTPTGRTNSRERISAFPLAGSDFGAGGEDVSNGPLVRIVTTQPASEDSDGGLLKQSNWLPVSSAAHVVQKSKTTSARGGAAFAGSTSVKRKRKEK